MKNIETERKFLVNPDCWRQVDRSVGEKYLQGYLCVDEKKSIRVRIVADRGIITIKGVASGFTRPEFEYNIPVAEAKEILALFTKRLIEKTRYKIFEKNSLWEVDEFHGANEGLILAEVELRDEKETIEKPEWIGTEVTGDRRYYNSYLSIHPFGRWPKKRPAK
jgi:adenylate cyclase